MAVQKYIKDDGTAVDLSATTKSLVLPATDAELGISRVATQLEFDKRTTGTNGPAFVTPEMMKILDELLGLCWRWHPVALANPHAGFYAPTGGLISNADTVVPRAWDYLQTAEGATLCVTQAQWDADRANSTWGGLQGACSKYVLDVAAKTIRLPDIRGVALEQAGFDSLTVGGIRGDRFQGHEHINPLYIGQVNSGPNVLFAYALSGGNTLKTIGAVSGARTGSYTAGRIIGVNYCVYLGT